MATKYKWLNGYTTSLNAKLSSTDGILPIDDAALLASKLDIDHSYLVINDGTGAEIVKAIAFGNQVKIERGKDGTESKTFPAGSCVKWEFTESAFNDLGCPSEEKSDCCCE
ncbi:hypothetical protein [Rodentibacter pneumotropicus]|uniref:Uncharacterized protein n=1 Tax=Rodentibacter pneumotropicus TaxID=758 RepID=A0A4S2Q8Y0_9PAST|nr:hypothetical protein [Rodentibacter pneumotropicus]THA12427.1 hypothetical protein D3M76_10020 [Rodentibacter pneumotropicus]